MERVLQNMGNNMGNTVAYFVQIIVNIISALYASFDRKKRNLCQYTTLRYPSYTENLSELELERLASVKRKTLVLDLDETLIHSQHDGMGRQTVARPGVPADFTLNVVIDNHPVSFFVHKRPHVDYFLETVSKWFDLVVFTASMEVYGKGLLFYL
jgi:CTD nuclear envelope phosphatase 1